jgi:glycosyltransferase involved in cell wall biosynthesis
VKKKLSIITINYNDRIGLEKTIQSVIGQSVSDFQYIIIDGASTDGSAQLLDKYADRIDFGISEKDSGIYNAMNKGARFADGDYLLFLNSGDELYDSDVIERVLPLLSGTDIICGSTLDYSEHESHLHIPPKNVSLFSFVGGSSLPHPSSFINRSLFEQIGGYHEEYRIVSDWCFFIEAIVLAHCSYATIPNIVTRFNCYGISSVSWKLRDEETSSYFTNKFKRIQEDYLPLQDEALANVVFWISMHHGFRGTLLRFPFKVVNRILRLRFRLDKRIKPVKQ